MIGRRVTRSYAITVITVMCAGLIALTPTQLPRPSLPTISVSAVNLTSADVPVTFEYIFDNQLPEFIQTVQSTYLQEFADLSDIWRDWFASGVSWTDGGASIESLNQEVLDWVNHVNVVGLNFVEDMDTTEINGEVIYGPSLCNLIFNFAEAGNNWLASLNGSAMAGLDGLNQGMANFFDGLSQYALDLSAGF